MKNTICVINSGLSEEEIRKLRSVVRRKAFKDKVVFSTVYCPYFRLIGVQDSLVATTIIEEISSAAGFGFVWYIESTTAS